MTELETLREQLVGLGLAYIALVKALELASALPAGQMHETLRGLCEAGHEDRSDAQKDAICALAAGLGELGKPPN